MEGVQRIVALMKIIPLGLVLLVNSFTAYAASPWDVWGEPIVSCMATKASLATKAAVAAYDMPDSYCPTFPIKQSIDCSSRKPSFEKLWAVVSTATDALAEVCGGWVALGDRHPAERARLAFVSLIRRDQTYMKIVNARKVAYGKSKDEYEMTLPAVSGSPWVK